MAGQQRGGNFKSNTPNAGGKRYAVSDPAEASRPMPPAMFGSALLSIATARAPEDVGALPGFEEPPQRNGKATTGPACEVVNWYGFEPEVISVATIKERISKLARRRTLGKRPSLKSQNKRH
ncbi:hypothetical protein [Rhizobium sp. LC145]|uniref:hypothetical protein n=1 Tax=Rhizobium sp. LC145 TaxID=1120688 RepID=UPI00062A1D6F|nr:hypothetical protein [Rhizobium sp. LC145]KKX32954.1 hypothetical protein YH62_05230 [Rhizobium sp. LC145]TKT57366.1 hypothetical protein FDR95_13895 [Rhizobiaceae bacterium LC148]